MSLSEPPCSPATHEDGASTECVLITPCGARAQQLVQPVHQTVVCAEFHRKAALLSAFQKENISRQDGSRERWGVIQLGSHSRPRLGEAGDVANLRRNLQ